MVISLDLSLLCSCRLQIVEYICVDNPGALKHLLVEIDYNWHLVGKKPVTFLDLFAFWKVTCRILLLILPISACRSLSLP